MFEGCLQSYNYGVTMEISYKITFQTKDKKPKPTFQAHQLESVEILYGTA